MFKHGDVVILMGIQDASTLNGLDGTITGAFRGDATGWDNYHQAITLVKNAWPVAVNGLGQCLINQNNLRKKPPPKDPDMSLVKWEDCCWQPPYLRDINHETKKVTTTVDSREIQMEPGHIQALIDRSTEYWLKELVKARTGLAKGVRGEKKV